MKFPDCKCGKNNWLHMPDSLAWACRECGRVIIYKGKGKWSKGASIQKWLSDINPDLPRLKDPDEE